MKWPNSSLYVEIWDIIIYSLFKQLPSQAYIYSYIPKNPTRSQKLLLFRNTEFKTFKLFVQGMKFEKCSHLTNIFTNLLKYNMFRITSMDKMINAYYLRTTGTCTKRTIL